MKIVSNKCKAYKRQLRQGLEKMPQEDRKKISLFLITALTILCILRIVLTFYQK